MAKRNSKLVTVVSAGHNEKLITGLWNAYKAQNKVDLLLMEWGDKSLVAHQVVADVFMSSSKLLGGALADIPGNPDDLMSNAELLLEFLYTGQVSVGAKQLNGLLEMAKELDFEDLIEALQFANGSKTLKQEPVTMGRASLRRKQSKPLKVVQPCFDEEEEEEEDESDSPPAKKRKSVDLPYAPPLKLKPTKTPKATKSPKTPKPIKTLKQRRAGRKPAAVATPKVKREPRIKGEPKKNRTKPIKQCKWPECNYTCATRGELKLHRRTHLHKCEHCDFANSQKSQVDVHNKKVHLQIRPFICETCGFAAFSQHQLVQHTRRHTGEKPFVCDVCGRAFSDPSTFARHGRGHGVDVPRPFACEQCNFKSHRKDAYKVHMKTVHGEPREGKRRVVRQPSNVPVKCRLCPFVADRQAHMTRHVRSVHGPTVHAFYCDMCEYTGKTSLNVKKHRRIHTGEKPYVCAKCSFPFRDYSTYKRHRLRHCKPDAEKPFACPICPRTFFLLRYLKAHLKSDHNEAASAVAAAAAAATSAAHQSVQQQQQQQQPQQQPPQQQPQQQQQQQQPQQQQPQQQQPQQQQPQQQQPQQQQLQQQPPSQQQIILLRPSTAEEQQHILERQHRLLQDQQQLQEQHQQLQEQLQKQEQQQHQSESQVLLVEDVAPSSCSKEVGEGVDDAEQQLQPQPTEVSVVHPRLHEHFSDPDMTMQVQIITHDMGLGPVHVLGGYI